MKTCKKCGKLKEKNEFRTYITRTKRKLYRNNCIVCEARANGKLKKQTIKKEPKEIVPIFINSSVISIDACHTVKANIQNGSKVYKLEKKFDARKKAEMFIEQINQDPRLASQFISDAKKVDYRKTKVIFSV